MTKQDILNAFREKFYPDLMKLVDDPKGSVFEEVDIGDVEHWLLNALTEFEREAIEKLAEEYGDFRISKKNKKGRALRFYLLPHTKHKEGDDEER